MLRVIPSHEAIGKTIAEITDGGRVGSITFTDGTAIIIEARNSGYRILSSIDGLTLNELDGAGIYDKLTDWIHSDRADKVGVPFSKLNEIVSGT